jgi:hypothetical protein
LVLDLEGSPRKAGRSGVPQQTRELIRTLSRDNVFWGAPRIHSELLKLGITVSQASVAKYTVRHPKPPSQTWRTFLKNHASQLASMDFFTVPTVWFGTLFVFIVFRHDRRRIVHFNVTSHPTAEWTEQQTVEAFPFDTAGLRDRNRASFAQWFDFARSSANFLSREGGSSILYKGKTTGLPTSLGSLSRSGIQVWRGQADSFPNGMIEIGTGNKILWASRLDVFFVMNTVSVLFQEALPGGSRP